MGVFISNMGVHSHIGSSIPILDPIWESTPILDPIWEYFVKILFGLAVGANMGVFFSNMGSFLFVDISNVAVDILTLS